MCSDADSITLKCINTFVLNSDVNKDLHFCSAKHLIAEVHIKDFCKIDVCAYNVKTKNDIFIHVFLCL